jgi:hypothetical protein
MASILLVEDGPGVGHQLTSLLAAAGHRVLRCGGGPTPLAACPLLRQGSCPLPAAAELLVFACPLGLPLRGRSYRGIHLLHAYRATPTTGGFLLCWWRSRPRRTWRDRGRPRWWGRSRTRLWCLRPSTDCSSAAARR